jgi:hypothetical protein
MNIIPLKPNWELLKSYNYLNNKCKSNTGDSFSNDQIDDYELNNIPGNANHISSQLRYLCELFGVTTNADTLIYICLDQADWFYSQLASAYYSNQQALKLQQLAKLILVLGDKEQEKSLKLYVGSEPLATIDHPHLISQLRPMFLKLLVSINMFPEYSEENTGLPISDEALLSLYLLEVRKPNRLENKLRTVFIHKVHEFIKDELTLQSRHAFTKPQREFIFGLGEAVGVFKDDPQKAPNEYIKSIYKENIEWMRKNMDERGRVTLK